MSWKPGVHKLDGVLLPLDVEYTLSVNLKFLFPVRYSQQVAEDWFNELARKARIKTFFWQRRTGLERETRPPSWIESIPYIPTGWDTDIDDDWFAEGIQVGRKSLRHALHGQSIPRPDPRDDALYQAILPPKKLRDWLQQARLMALITDKNLGIAVVTRLWYETQIDAFSIIPEISLVVGGKAEFIRERGRIAYHLENHLLYFRPSRIHPFLNDKRVLALWRTAYAQTELPIFHGIPKIHKNPWKIRPIVPMHSYVTGPLARILHAMLLPVQRSFLWICESSRNLCAEVADYNKSAITSTRLHSGDVVSMYTKIRWTNFRHALLNVLESGLWYDEPTRSWILEAVEFLWNGTFFQMGTRVFRQEDGVPMGLHCAPVLANIYMAHFEKEFLQRTPSIRLYRRYIDDCFALDENDEPVTTLTVPGLAIQWSHSAHELPFLDVRFHTHPDSAEVCFAPYSKALSHHQYLPWASSHPLSVKKGLVKGELSRIRAISYKELYFLAWKATFLSRLRARGWPKQALQSWGRQVQWQNHFPRAGLVSKKRGDAIMVVSEYNPVWEQISSPAIWRDMRQAWIRRGPSDLPYPPRIITAMKRTRSMWDLIRAVNRTFQPEIEEIDIEELSVDMSSLSSEMEMDVI
jgi:hypothetical protein